MPIEVHDEAQGPPGTQKRGGSDPTGAAAIPGVTPDQLRPTLVALLLEHGVIPDHTPGTPARPDAALTGDVDETEFPQSINNPVITVGEPLALALKREDNRGRVVTTLLWLLGMVLTGTVIACLRLPPEQGVERLADLADTMLLAVAGALTYYFGGNALSYYINRKAP